MEKRMLIRKIGMLCMRLYGTAMVVVGIPFGIYGFSRDILAPSVEGVFMFLVFSGLAAGGVESGPLGIKKVVVVGEVIEERILWGLFRLKTKLADVSGFNTAPRIGTLGGEFQQIIIKRNKRPSILVDESDQSDFASLRAALKEKIVEDNSIKATGWAELKRLFGLMLALWGATVLVGLGLWVKRQF